MNGSSCIRFGARLREAQDELLLKNQTKAALKKAKEDIRLGPGRIRQRRFRERQRYKQQGIQTRLTAKADAAALKAERQALRAAKRAAKTQALWLETNAGTFKALNLQPGLEQAVFLKIRELFPPLIVSRLIQGGFLPSERTSAAIDYLTTSSRTSFI